MKNYWGNNSVFPVKKYPFFQNSWISMKTNIPGNILQKKNRILLLQNQNSQPMQLLQMKEEVV
jgi:hypothetical protein